MADDPFAAVRAKASEEDPFAAVRSQSAELLTAPDGQKLNVPKNLKSHYEKLGFLPAAGAIAGGFMGGGGLTKMLGIGVNPVAAGGAAAGAAGGETLRQVASTAMGAMGGEAGVPDGTVALLKEQGKAAAAAGIAELGGQQVVRGLGWIGRGLGQSALKATPEIVQTAVREGIAASQGGLKKAATKISGLASEARQIAAAATRGGVRLDIPRGVAQPTLNKIGQEIIDSGVNVEERLKVLEEIGKRVVRDNPGQSAPTKVLAFRQAADSEAKAIYTARARGQYIPPTQLEEARIWKELADNAREFVNQIPSQFKGKSGTMAEVNARNSALIQVRDAVHKVARPGKDLSERIGTGLAVRGIGAGLGGAWGALGGEGKLPGGMWMRAAEGAALGGALASPGILMGLARATNSRALERGIPAVFQTGTGLYRSSKKEQ